MGKKNRLDVSGRISLALVVLTVLVLPLAVVATLNRTNLFSQAAYRWIPTAYPYPKKPTPTPKTPSPTPAVIRTPTPLATPSVVRTHTPTPAIARTPTAMPNFSY